MIKAKAAGAKNAWRPYTGGNGYMGISLHSSNHQGGRLEALVNWVNEEGHFDFFRVGLSDTLNRHNYVMQEKISYAHAHEKARLKGQKWLDDNLAIIEKLKIPYELIRWDYWLDQHSANIESNRSEFYKAFDENPILKDAILKDVSSYFNRSQNGDLNQIDPDQVALSIEYLIEELAVYSVLFEGYPSTAIYPGRQLNCFQVIRDGSVGINIPVGIGASKHIRLALHDNAEPAALAGNKPANHFIMT